MDDVLESEHPWVENLLELFDCLSVFFVGVHCPLVKLERREKERKDGMARYHIDQVHSVAICDVELDTSRLNPQECAAIIIEHISTGSKPMAFDQLREKRLRNFQSRVAYSTIGEARFLGRITLYIG